jgi:ubiquinone/menaquinone biosynthesis C-methylase UbiE
MAATANPHAVPDQIDYLDRVASSMPGRGYKRDLLVALALRPGMAVLDVGCGPGTDLGALAAAVTESGQVRGIDTDPRMRAEAALRSASYPQVRVDDGHAEALPLDDRSMDRARADRVLQHVGEPIRALLELYRVVRPDGIIGLAEPDWYTLIIDDADLGTSEAFSRFMTSRVRNPAIGRQLARLAAGAGFAIRSVSPHTIVFRDYAQAEQILGIARNVQRGIDGGALEPVASTAWLHRISRSPAFLASVTLFTVTAVAA